MGRSRTEYLVGRQIRAAANNAGMTIKTLGEKLGVSKPTIYAYTTGALHVPDSRLAEIAEITGHSVEFFSSDTEQDELGLQEQMKLIDATLSPPDPRTASRLALAVIERESENDDPVALAKLSFRAGNALLQHGDYFDAIQQLEHSRRSFLNLGHMEYAANASQSLGFCYINLGRLDKARDSFVYSRDHLPPEQKWMGAIALAALAERLGEFEQADRDLQKLLQVKKLDATAVSYVYANLATLHSARTDWQGAKPYIAKTLEAAYSNRQGDLCVEMLVLMSQVLSREGRLSEASDNLIRAYDIALGLDDQSRQTLVEVAWSELLMFSGQLDDARNRAVAALSMATRGGFIRSEGVALRILAETALLRGDKQQTRDYAIQAVSHAESHQYPVNCALASLILAKAYFALGDIARATNLTDEAAETASRIQLPEVSLIARSHSVFLGPKPDLTVIAKQISAECKHKRLLSLERIIEKELEAVGNGSPSGMANANGYIEESIFVLNNGIKERITLEINAQR